MADLLLAGGALAAILGLVGLLHYWSRDLVVRRRLRQAKRVPVENFADGGVGKVVGTLRLVEPPLQAPVSGRPCAYFRIELETRTKNSWTTLRREQDVQRTFEVVDETGVALVEVRDPRNVSAVHDVTYEKSIATSEPPAELERYLARVGHPNEGMGIRVVESVLEEGEQVTVLGPGVREPWSDPRARRGGYRAAGTRLVIRPRRDAPVLVSDDPAVSGRDPSSG